MTLINWHITASFTNSASTNIRKYFVIAYLKGVFMNFQTYNQSEYYNEANYSAKLRPIIARGTNFGWLIALSITYSYSAHFKK